MELQAIVWKERLLVPGGSRRDSEVLKTELFINLQLSVPVYLPNLMR